LTGRQKFGHNPFRMAQKEKEEKEEISEKSESEAAGGQSQEIPEQAAESVSNKEKEEKEEKEEKVNSISVRKWVAIVGLGVLVALVIIGFGGMYYYRSQIPAAPETAVVPTPQPEVEEPVSTSPPEPKKEANLSKLSVEVLNGSGVAGAAGRVRDILEKGGFQNIEVGNAGSSAHRDTTVSMKEGIADSVLDVIEKLLDAYTVVSGDVLDEDGQVDIIITVGARN